MISFHTSPRLLATVPLGLFLGLTLVIAVLPALGMNERHRADPDAPAVAPDVARGRALYVAEGCHYCHTQQVRSDTRAKPGADAWRPVLRQDARYGSRPSRPQDYAAEEPPLLGSERVGPDLANVGERLPSADWHYLHLFDPRFLVPDSVMPSYRWYFHADAEHEPGDRPILISDAHRERMSPGGTDRKATMWATPDAQAIIAYLLSLRQASNP